METHLNYQKSSIFLNQQEAIDIWHCPREPKWAAHSNLCQFWLNPISANVISAATPIWWQLWIIDDQILGKEAVAIRQHATRVVGQVPPMLATLSHMFTNLTHAQHTGLDKVQ